MKIILVQQQHVIIVIMSACWCSKHRCDTTDSIGHLKWDFYLFKESKYSNVSVLIFEVTIKQNLQLCILMCTSESMRKILHTQIDKRSSVCNLCYQRCLSFKHEVGVFPANSDGQRAAAIKIHDECEPQFIASGDRLVEVVHNTNCKKLSELLDRMNIQQQQTLTTSFFALS